MPTSVVLCDDHRLLREGLRKVIESDADLEVIGESDNGRDTVRLARQLEPDVVVMDVSMPDLNGIDATRQIRDLGLPCKVLALSMHSDDQYVKGMLQAGASGYMLKSSTPRELVEGLQSLAAGGSPMSPRIARAVVMEFREVKAEAELQLTPRERQVLVGIDNGFTYKEIAADMGLSHHTVHGYVKSRYEKLHARGRREALTQARRRGLV